MNRLPLNSVRGRIRAYIERHAAALGDDVLEVGSRIHDPAAWWCTNRDLANGQWTGIDMQAGEGVDQVADIHELPAEWSRRFSGIVCSEVLEHVARPWLALPELRRVLQPGGLLVITTLFAFPEHGYPDDYYRYSQSGLRLLLAEAGFSDVATEYAGEVPIELIDQAVGRVLGAKYDLGLFHDPYLRIGKAAGDPVEVNAEGRLHRQAARQVARDSLVLLENRQQTLPLRKEATIALVGPLADSHVDMLGSWSAAGVAAQTVTLRQGLEAAVGDSGRVIHARGANVTDDPRLIEYLNFLNWDRPEVTQDPRPPQAMIDEAVRAAREADVIVAAVGESRGMSHESSSRTSLTLPASQQALLEALAATGKPLVVVLMNGRPLQLGWVKDNADAVLETWFAGTEGGHAIAEVLLGVHNPSGKLPISFPRSVGQIPTYYNHPRLGRPYVEGRPGNYTSQYFEEPNGALYPFGYGLSYTEFELAKPQLSRHQLKRGQILEVSVTVKNTGARAGATVVQLYLQDLVGSSVRPIKELKRFEKLMLEPGESRVVRFELGEDDLKFPDARLDYVAESGEFEVQLGLDSRSVQSVRFELL